MFLILWTPLLQVFNFVSNQSNYNCHCQCHCHEKNIISGVLFSNADSQPPAMANLIPQAWDPNRSFAVLTSALIIAVQVATHGSSSLRCQLCVKDLLAENLLENALRISSCGERASEQREKTPNGPSLPLKLWSPVVLQRCYSHSQRLGLFSLPCHQAFFRGCCREEGLTLYKARWYISWEKVN